jgi:hypothetical protein
MNPSTVSYSSYKPTPIGDSFANYPERVVAPSHRNNLSH